MLLDRNTRVQIKKRKTATMGVEITLQFQCRAWWFIWRNISMQTYIIHVHEFWDPFGWHQPGGRMDGQPLRDTGVYGIHFESWYPHSFNLDRRILEIYLEIKQQETITDDMYNRIQTTR